MPLMPLAMVRKSPEKRSALIITSMSPRSCSADMWFISETRPVRLERTCSIVSLMKAFLPGSASMGALKLPRPNSATQAIAFFFTAMWLPTNWLMPCAMAARSPLSASTSTLASMSPASCARLTRCRSSTIQASFARSACWAASSSPSSPAEADTCAAAVASRKSPCARRSACTRAWRSGRAMLPASHTASTATSSSAAATSPQASPGEMLLACTSVQGKTNARAATPKQTHMRMMMEVSFMMWPRKALGTGKERAASDHHVHRCPSLRRSGVIGC